MRTFVAPLLDSRGNVIASPSGQGIHWLDHHFYGELTNPPRLGRPLLILISGPPGSGKSLLAQQICYEVARDACLNDDDTKDSLEQATSLFVTSEAPPAALIKNLQNLGYDQFPNKNEKGTKQFKKAHKKKVYLYDFCPDLELNPFDLTHGQRHGVPLMLVTAGSSALEAAILRTQSASKDSTCLVKPMSEIWPGPQFPPPKDFPKFRDFPRILVIDSFNVLAGNPKQQQNVFDALLRSFYRKPPSRSKVPGILAATEEPFEPSSESFRGPEFLILILDIPGSSGSEFRASHAYWEYVADVAIRVDYSHSPKLGEYFARDFEIVKTRYQGHALGKQVAKIFIKPEVQFQAVHKKTDSRLVASSATDLLIKARAAKWKPNQYDVMRNLSTDPEGPRPNVERGGLFVFPSLHYILSQIRTNRGLVGTTSTRKRPAKIEWPARNCDKLAQCDVPLNETVAIIGPRGAKKSYFAYQFLLDGIKTGNERTLLLSFVDDPKASLETLERMGRRQGVSVPPDNPVVVYQRPGRVTPEEWMHRVITAVGEYSPTRAAVIALDQWDASYPSLAESKLLIPTLIDFLNVQKVTSMIVGVDFGAKGGSHGLTANANVVLSFEYRRVAWEADEVAREKMMKPSKGAPVDGYRKGVKLLHLSAEMEKNLATRDKVVVRAVRLPKGVYGFGRAILEKNDQELILVPLHPEYPEGNAVL